MGRGKHLSKIESKTQVNVKFTNSRLKLLVDNYIIFSGARLIDEPECEFNSANEYVNYLVHVDLKKRGLI